MMKLLRVCAVIALACVTAAAPGLIDHAPAFAQAAAPAAPAAPASGGFIDVGAAFGWLGPYVNTLVGGLISIGIGWILVIVRTKLNVSIDGDMRATLETWLKNQASSLVAAGVVRVDGLKISVPSANLAAAVNTGGAMAGDAITHFGLTPDVLAKKIINAIPQVPAVAAVSAAQAAPAPVA